MQRLAEDMVLEVYEPEGPRDQLWKTTRQRTYQAIMWALGPRRFIHNRMFFSELVYGPIIRRKVAFTSYEQRFIRDMLRALHCPVIVCMPPRDVIIENVMDGEHMDHVKENIDEIVTQYYSVFTQPAGQVIPFDYTGQLARKEMRLGERGGGHWYTSSYAGVKYEVEKYLQQRKERSW